MTGKIVVVHESAEHYAKALRKACPNAMIVPIVEATHSSRVFAEADRFRLADADAIVSIGRWMSPEIFAGCRTLKWFQCLITGTDHLDGILHGTGVILTNARGIHGSQMAELTILHMFASMRNVARLVHSKDERKWDRFTPRVLRGRSVAIVGVGAIGQAVAKLCMAFGMRTVGISRTPRPVEGFHSIEPREKLLSAVSDVDFVVVLLPLTPENEGFIGAEVFTAMKRDACLINISRGKIVDEAALVNALGTGQIAFAGLDVFQTSPLPPASPFWGMENVFVTPHIGGQSDRYDDDALEIVAFNARKFLAGDTGEMINVVRL